MTDSQNGNKVSRRFCLKSAGAAAIGTLSIAPSTAQAATGRVTGADFDYPVRTYGRSETIKVGMIGNIGHASVILNDIPSLENVELVAYSNKTSANMKLPANVRQYDTYDEMLDKEALDVVGVCLPYYLNAKASIAVAKKKIHVITEKPVATELGDFNDLLNAVTRNKVRLTALLNMRMMSQYQVIKAAIAQGEIGEPILATAQKSYKFGKSRPEFYKDIKTYGGTIPWVGIHALDYIHFTTGFDYTEVSAVHGNKDHPDYPGCQDYAGILLRTDTNGIAMINIDYLRPETAPTHGDDRLRIIGSEGVIEIKDLGTRVELINSKKEAHDLELHDNQSFMTDFIAELRGEGKHIIAPEEPFEITRVSLLARQSAEKNRSIKL